MNRKTTYIAAFAASGLTLMALAGVWILTQSPEKTSKQDTITYSEKLENFPFGTNATLEFITGNNTYTYETILPEGHSIENNVQAKNISAMNELYLLRSVAKISDTDYIDVELGIDKISDNISVSLSGFPLKGQAYIAVNGNSYSSSIPVDWAGQLKFNVKADDKLSGSDICLIMDGINNTALPTSLCHYVTKNEGQVSS